MSQQPFPAVPQSDLSRIAPSIGEWSDERARTLLDRMFKAAVDAARPEIVLPPHLPAPPKGRCVVVGAGKAAAEMAAVVDREWKGGDLSGAVVVPYGHGCPAGRIAILEASHPVPDAGSAHAARTMLELVEGLGPDDMLLSLISGGGSSVLSLPAAGLSLGEKQEVNRALLASGLDIRTMNAVRRRLSSIKGGRLAQRAAPARVVTLAISDIPGDDIAAIASGPTIADPTASDCLRDVAERLRPHIPAAAFALLSMPPARAGILPDSEQHLIATPAKSLAAAGAVARKAGIWVETLGDAIEGESREVGAQMAALASRDWQRPLVLLSGGETTVTLTGRTAGKGGRNSEFALALAMGLGSASTSWALAADTDGEDGASGGAAGAIVAPDTLARSASLGLDPEAFLQNHDSGSFFAALGDAIVTGPTRTNVNDFRAILLVPSS